MTAKKIRYRCLLGPGVQDIADNTQAVALHRGDQSRKGLVPFHYWIPELIAIPRHRASAVTSNFRYTPTKIGAEAGMIK